MEEHDQFETLGLDDSLEDERDLDQIMADRRAAELELETRDNRTAINSQRKPPSYSMIKIQMMTITDLRNEPELIIGLLPLRQELMMIWMEIQSTPGRSQRGNPREDVPMTDATDDDPYEDDDNEDGEFEMYRIQGTLREWRISAALRLITNSSSINTRGWHMLLTPSLKSWKKLLIKWCLTCIQITSRFIRTSMFASPTYQFMIRYADPPEHHDLYWGSGNTMFWGISLVTAGQNSYSEVKVGSCPECQSKGPFSVNVEQTVFRNYQKLTLQESPGICTSVRLPRYKEVILLNDLNHNATLTFMMGSCNGFPVFATVIEANHVTKKQNLFSIYKLTEEDMTEIEKLSKNPRIGERIVKSIALSIYGHEDIKTVIALAMFGGQEKNNEGKHRLRDMLKRLDKELSIQLEKELLLRVSQLHFTRSSHTRVDTRSYLAVLDFTIQLLKTVFEENVVLALVNFALRHVLVDHNVWRYKSKQARWKVTLKGEIRN